MKKFLSILLCAAMLLGAVGAVAEDGVFHGEADGFGGPITAEVTVEGGRIVGLTLTGAKETPEIGGKALAPLTEAILAAGTVDGVEALTGATMSLSDAHGDILGALLKAISQAKALK